MMPAHAVIGSLCADGMTTAAAPAEKDGARIDRRVQWGDG